MVTDSTSYLPDSFKKQFDISIVSLSINFGSETFREVDISNETFYTKLNTSTKIPTSSQPTLRDFYTVFENHVLNGNEVVGVFLSSDMSGTYHTAMSAKNMILEKHPHASIEIVDSRSNCMQLGFAVLAAAKAAQNGASISEVVAQANYIIKRSRFLFTPDNLTYLKKGGRIGGAAALLGSLLQIKPILTVVDGKTSVYSKVRTKSKAIKEIIDVCFNDIDKKGLGDIAIHHINNEAEGKLLADMIVKKYNVQVPLYSIGPVIGVHVGPGAVGIVYYTEEEL